MVRASKKAARRTWIAFLIATMTHGNHVLAQSETDAFEVARSRYLTATQVSDGAQRKSETLRAIVDLKDFLEAFPTSARADEIRLMIGQAYRTLALETRDRDDASRALHYFKQVEQGGAPASVREEALLGIEAVCDDVLHDRACRKEAAQKREKLHAVAKAPHPDLSPIDLTEFAKARSVPSPSELPTATMATIRSLQTETRGGHWTFRIEFDQPVPGFSSKFLPESSKTSTPPRFYVDLDHAKLPSTVSLPSLKDQSTIQSVRMAQNTAERVRLVFDLQAGAKEGDFEVRSQERLFLVTVRAAGTPAPAIAWSDSESEMAPPKKAATSKSRYRIILDPGHGGDDPGAKGPKGTFEKDVCLDIALRLREILQKNPKYEVFMTRDNDRTLALGDRTRFANRIQGDLFVSIHANASPKRSAKGVSTYFLHNADDQESLRVAMRENGELSETPADTNASEDHYLEVMKASMVKNFHTTQSTDLARQVQSSMLAALRSGYRDVHDIGVKSARFYVLTGAQMPAILVETSFISNPVEESRLKNAGYQNTIAKAIVRGVDKFFKIQEKSPTHAVSRPSL